MSTSPHQIPLHRVLTEWTGRCKAAQCKEAAAHPPNASVLAAKAATLNGQYTGEEAARIGLVNQAFPIDALESKVLGLAARIAEIPAEALAINKRFVYTAMEHQGARAIIRTGGDLQAGPHLQSFSGSSAELSEEIRSGQRKRRDAPS